MNLFEYCCGSLNRHKDSEIEGAQPCSNELKESELAKRRLGERNMRKIQLARDEQGWNRSRKSLVPYARRNRKT